MRSDHAGPRVPHPVGCRSVCLPLGLAAIAADPGEALEGASSQAKRWKTRQQNTDKEDKSNEEYKQGKERLSPAVTVKQHEHRQLKKKINCGIVAWKETLLVAAWSWCWELRSLHHHWLGERGCIPLPPQKPCPTLIFNFFFSFCHCIAHWKQHSGCEKGGKKVNRQNSLVP